MLHTILFILKIIGIILLTIVLIVLLLAFLIAFVPICYRIEGKKTETHAWSIKLTWMNPVVNFFLSYKEEKLDKKLKIMGITVLLDKEEREAKRLKKKAEKENKPPKQKPEKRKKLTRQKPEEEKIQTVSSGVKASIKTETIKKADTGVNAGKETTNIPKPEADNKKDADGMAPKPENGTDTDHRESRIRKIVIKVKNFFIRIYEFVTGIVKCIRNLKYTITNLYVKIKSWNEKKNYYLAVLKSESTKRALENIKKQALILLKHINPKKTRIYLKYGTGEPENDGILLGLIGMIYPLFGNSLQVETDFNNEILVYDVYMRGKIQIIVLIKIAWKLYFDKDLKELLKKVNIKEEE